MKAIKLIVAILIASIVLAACAGFQQAVTGYESAAIKGVQSAEDNNIAMWTVNACGTPFSAAIRHPEVVSALKALCLPSGSASNPSTLLDAAQEAKFNVPATQFNVPSPGAVK